LTSSGCLKASMLQSRSHLPRQGCAFGVRIGCRRPRECMLRQHCWRDKCAHMNRVFRVPVFTPPSHCRGWCDTLLRREAPVAQSSPCCLVTQHASCFASSCPAHCPRRSTALQCGSHTTLRYHARQYWRPTRGPSHLSLHQWYAAALASTFLCPVFLYAVMRSSLCACTSSLNTTVWPASTMHVRARTGIAGRVRLGRAGSHSAPCPAHPRCATCGHCQLRHRR
jgi:hypothetical protein